MRKYLSIALLITVGGLMVLAGLCFAAKPSPMSSSDEKAEKPPSADLVLAVYNRLLNDPIPIAYAQQQRDTLTGLEGVAVLVGVPEIAGIETKVLQASVELSLRNNGVKVVDASKIGEVPGRPTLIVTCDIFPYEPLPLYAITVSVGLTQTVLLGRNPFLQTVAETWQDSYYGCVPKHDIRMAVKQSVQEKVDVFCNDYLKANQGQFNASRTR